VVVVGNPNAGKSTVFAQLSGTATQVGNYAGTTVEKQSSTLMVPGAGQVILVDVPGTYSLLARSPEERVVLDSVLGLEGRGPDALVVVVDTLRLSRSLYLILQLLELQIPMVVALNFMDEVRARGREPNLQFLCRTLGVPVVELVGRTGEGIPLLIEQLADVLAAPEDFRPGCPHDWSAAVQADLDRIRPHIPPAALADVGSDSHRERALALWYLLTLKEGQGPPANQALQGAVHEVVTNAERSGRDLEAELVGQRYVWIDAREREIFGEQGAANQDPRTDRIDRLLLHPLSGGLIFLGVMALVFQALFSWSDPFISGIEAGMGQLSFFVAFTLDYLIGVLPFGGAVVTFFRNLMIEGIIGGVGAVVVFVPQIAVLFFFIALLEDSGYLARAAYLVDRLMVAAGLPGQAFVPLLSGYACAVPAIMATRTMPRFRDRLATMLVLPLTSCSARLPVYTLVIAALFPATLPGWPLAVRPTVLFCMYLFSAGVTLAAAMVLGRFILPGRAEATMLELPPYRVPHLPTVARLVRLRVMDFLKEAGRIILLATVVLWGLLSYPSIDREQLAQTPAVTEAVAMGEQADDVLDALALEQSYAGRMGHWMEPAIEPLGFDWKIGVGILGSFAAREVFVSTMGLVFGVGESDEESVSLRDRLAQGGYSPLSGLSLMVFFALAMQCLSTLAVMKRETGSWRWPLFSFVYMSALAWVVAFVVYQGGIVLGFGV